jgi:hypothetical protein
VSDHNEDPRGSMMAVALGVFALCCGAMGAFLMWLFQRYCLHLAFIWSLGWFTVGLCAQDVPTWVLRGIAAVETGVHWHDMGEISGTWSKNSTGDVGPWHISPAALKDLNRTHLAERINREAVLAESVARLWLLHLYRTTGCWHETVAAWRAGLDGRHRDYARDYAVRAFNYGTAY